MSNIGIAVKSGSFPRFVYGNKLVCQSRDAWVIRWARARWNFWSFSYCHP